MHDILSIITFSIKVASVMGSFNEVPKQAQSISVLLTKVLITPIEVIDKKNGIIAYKENNQYKET